MKKLIDFSVLVVNEKATYMTTKSVVQDDAEDGVDEEQREVVVVLEGDRDEECEGRRLRGKGRKEVQEQVDEMEADLSDKKYPPVSRWARCRSG
eukprot:766435-Hanusia_phi.AAC.1